MDSAHAVRNLPLPFSGNRGYRVVHEFEFAGPALNARWGKGFSSRGT
jgi:hypothetical protein